MTVFALHPQLEKDSLFVRDLSLSQLRLNNQKMIPWLVLVPRRANVQEIYELTQEDRLQLMTEIVQVSQVLTQLYAPDKINIGALGNVVPQLHIHVIARFVKDEAWPAPVWGNVTSNLYAAEDAALAIAQLNKANFWQ